MTTEHHLLDVRVRRVNMDEYSVGKVSGALTMAAGTSVGSKVAVKHLYIMLNCQAESLHTSGLGRSGK